MTDAPTFVGFDQSVTFIVEDQSISVAFPIPIGAGESNTSSNLGAGEGLASAKVGADLPFKSVTGSGGIAVTSTPTEIDFDGSALGGGAHALGGSLHTPDTLANLNTKVSDATLDDASAARTPTAHASAHQDGGADEVATATPGANVIPKAGAGSTLADGFIAESGVTQHEGAIDHDALTNFDIAKHRIINDAGVSTIEMWSASKIDAELSAVIAGIDTKEGVDTSTAGLGNITLSGEQTLNGLLTSASRVMVTEQTAAEDNGSYTSAAGAWTRAPDSDTDAEVTNGNIIHVINPGSTKFKFKYLLVSPDPIAVGTDAQTWEEHRDIDFGTTGGTATEGDDSRVPTQDENDALVGTDGTPSTANKYVTNTDARNSDARTPTSHALAGSEHSASTLASLNTKVSDATLIDTADTRIPTQDENDALVGTDGAPSTSNKYVTNSDPRNSDARTPTAHGLGAAEHTADTLANLNTKVSDATLDDSSASRPPTGTASGGLGGTYPGPSVDGMTSGVLTDDTAHGARGGGTQHADVIAGGADGFMTGSDKTKLDDLATGAEVRLLTPAPAADLTGNGTGAIVTVDTNGVGIAAALFMAADGNYDEADASAAATMPCTVIALETGTGSKKVLIFGFIRNDVWTWTPGGRIYVSETPGQFTQTRPTTSGAAVQPVGIAESADVIKFTPVPDFVEVE